MRVPAMRWRVPNAPDWVVVFIGGGLYNLVVHWSQPRAALFCFGAACLIYVWRYFS